MTSRFCLLMVLPNGFNIFHFHRYPWLWFLLQDKVHNHNRAITVGLNCNTYYSLSSYYFCIYFSNENSVRVIKRRVKPSKLLCKHLCESNTESASSWYMTYRLSVKSQKIIQRFWKKQCWFPEMYKERKKLFAAREFTKFGIWFQPKWHQGMTQLFWFTDSLYESSTHSTPVGVPGNKSCSRTVWIHLCQRLPRQQQVTEQ